MLVDRCRRVGTVSAPPSATRSSVAAATVRVLAVVAQAVVSVVTFFAGMLWGGPVFGAAAVLAAAGIWLVVRLGDRRSRWVAAVPVASALVGAVLFLGTDQYLAATACTDREKEAFAQLPPPAGIRLGLEGDSDNGCTARARTDLAGADVAAHYAAALREHGWTIRTEQETYLEADRDGVGITVDVPPTAAGGWLSIEIADFSDR